MTGLQAVIFDVDGTIADTERYGHRVAFNLAFEGLGLPYRWDEEPYGTLLELPGGEQRLDKYLRAQGLLPAEAAPLAAQLQARKQELFLSLLQDGAVPLRAGVARLMDELAAEGISLAVATTGGRIWVLELLDRLLGEGRSGRLVTVVTGEDVSVRNRKPHPEAYQIALQRLGCRPSAAVAIEDANVGLRAAKAAHLACLVTTNSYTTGHDFSQADLVVDSLGTPEQPVHVLANPQGMDVEAWITPATLRRLLALTVTP